MYSFTINGYIVLYFSQYCKVWDRSLNVNDHVEGIYFILTNLSLVLFYMQLVYEKNKSVDHLVGSFIHMIKLFPRKQSVNHVMFWIPYVAHTLSYKLGRHLWKFDLRKSIEVVNFCFIFWCIVKGNIHQILSLFKVPNVSI